jgi:hypothetical protein
VDADLQIVHGRSPRAEIIRSARALQPDLVVMGAHGHRIEGFDLRDHHRRGSSCSVCRRAGSRGSSS